MAEANTERSELKRIMADLESIEFETGSDIRRYVETTRKLSRALSMELEFSAQELEAALRELPPGDGESRLAMRRKAKSVTRHLRRCAEAQRTVGVEAVRTWASLHKHFEYLVKRKKRKKALDLSA
ncbi:MULTISPECIES: hypothetical protein [unclassified Nocardiopsis]|uniref:hypothetical protein n=1 Tax=unclassified Nocardiopsis TaxID=2649073 RepID=UPI001E4E3885|nr:MULTISPECIES: hypothetical protein [unclassified Nocardiopsis]MCY9787165.1 hypothetical protein [Nocardiopsis sp. EMB25]